MDWQILKDVLNTAWNIASAAYEGVGGWEGVGGLTIPVDTASQQNWGHYFKKVTSY